MVLHYRYQRKNGKEVFKNKEVNMKGKIYCIGTGPGNQDLISERALKAIEESSVVAGYGVYIDLIPELLEGKELITTPMRQEVLRCEMAVKKAEEGLTVSLISSGDAGVYGMAGLLYETAENSGVEIEVVPGISAVLAAAAKLGAPLTHDFAVISLSDLLTPWEKIEKRLKNAAEAEFIISIYNPASKKRADYLKRACEIMSPYINGDTLCGYVRNCERENEETGILTFNELKDFQADMFTLIIIGNSTTKLINNRLVTPRGYKRV